MPVVEFGLRDGVNNIGELSILRWLISRVTPHHLLSNSAGVRDFAAPVISNDDPALGNMVRSWKDEVFFADQGEIYSYSSGKIEFLFFELYGAKKIK